MSARHIMRRGVLRLLWTNTRAPRTNPPCLPLAAADVAAFLTARFGDSCERIARVGQGKWSTAFAFRHADREFVVRFGAHRDDFDKDRLAARFASAGLPILAVVAIGEAFGGFYAVSERAFGAYLDDLDESQLRALLPALFATLDAMREVDVGDSAGFGAWSADGVAPYSSWRAALLDVGTDRPTDRTYGWREKLVRSAIGPGPFQEGLGHLATLAAACPEERHLVHSDLLNRNVLVDDGRLSAVIDWGCGMYGDFLYDVAWFAYWAPWYPAWHGIDFVAEAAAHYATIGLAVPCFAERVRWYQVHIGLAGLAYRAYGATCRPVGRDDGAAHRRRLGRIADTAGAPSRNTASRRARRGVLPQRGS